MKSNPQSLRSDARRNYDLIVTTARKILALPDTTFSFNELAKHAGVGIGTLYRHFPTKHSLLVIVYREKLAALNKNALGRLPADQALEQWIKQLVELSRSSAGFDLLIDEAIRDTQSSLFTSGSGLLKKAQKVGSLRTDVDINELLGLIKGIVTLGPDLKGPQIKTMLSVIIAGLKK